jgi:hypothetical protein
MGIIVRSYGKDIETIGTIVTINTIPPMPIHHSSKKNPAKGKLLQDVILDSHSPLSIVS